MAQPTFDLKVAHRWFAVEANNEAWDLLELPARDAAQTARMLACAHAAAYHWRVAGTAINELRAETLLASVYTAAASGTEAIRHADRAQELARTCAEATMFDLASASGCAAHAYNAAGRSGDAQEKYAEALFAATDLPAEDRAVFDKFFPVMK